MLLNKNHDKDNIYDMKWNMKRYESSLIEESAK